MHGISGTFSVGMCDRQEPIGGGEIKLSGCCARTQQRPRGTWDKLHLYCHTLRPLSLPRNGGHNNGPCLLNAYRVHHCLIELAAYLRRWALHSHGWKRRPELAETDNSLSHAAVRMPRWGQNPLTVLWSRAAGSDVCFTSRADDHTRFWMGKLKPRE